MTKRFLLLLALMMPLWATAQVLRFATWDGSENLDIQRRIAAAFEQRHPGVRVQVEAYGGGFNQKLSASFGARNPPDVTMMWNFPLYHRVLEPLNAWQARDPAFDAADMVPGLLRFATVESRLYGVPAGFTSQVIYYNKDMFDRAGLAYPKADWRWEDLRALSQKLSRPGAKVYGYGLDVAPDPYDFQGYLWSAGGRMLGADGRKVQGEFDSAHSQAMFTMLLGLLDQGLAATLGVGDGKNQRQLFVADRVAMLMDGAAFRLELAQDGKRYGVAPLPSFQGRPAQSVVSVSSLAMARDSKQKDLAWQFIKFYSSAEAVRMRQGDLPVLLSVARELKLQDDPLVQPFYAMALSMQEVPAFLLNPRWTRASGVVRDAIQEVFLKKGDVQQILARAALKAERKLQ
ncbi:MAG: sugar ABC transporter substrate-binding protein [Burkholderiaceae bacterium]|nr:sugar ABC transporter substrate-binding protein [Burkholderiaceae bacterium]